MCEPGLVTMRDAPQLTAPQNGAASARLATTVPTTHRHEKAEVGLEGVHTVLQTSPHCCRAPQASASLTALSV